MLPLHRILCPTDFSDFSFEAIEKGAELAKHFGAELCVLYVAQPIQPIQGMSPYLGYADLNGPQYDEAVRKGAERELRKIVERHQLNAVSVLTQVEMGHPGDEIVSAAQKGSFDLIVIATHGRTGWRQFIFGSVAEKVLRLALCPVLVIRVVEPQEK